MRREKFIDTARLAISCEGNIAFGKEAIEVFGNASEIFELGHREAVERFPPLAAIAGRLFSHQTADAAARDVDWALEHGVEMVTLDSEDYPHRLRECPDPPLMLYLRGRCNFHRERFIAIVGTRAATQYGRQNLLFDKRFQGTHCGGIRLIQQHWFCNIMLQKRHKQ